MRFKVIKKFLNNTVDRLFLSYGHDTTFIQRWRDSSMSILQLGLICVSCGLLASCHKPVNQHTIIVGTMAGQESELMQVAKTFEEPGVKVEVFFSPLFVLQSLPLD